MQRVLNQRVVRGILDAGSIDGEPFPVTRNCGQVVEHFANANLELVGHSLWLFVDRCAEMLGILLLWVGALFEHYFRRDENVFTLVSDESTALDGRLGFN